MSSEMNPELVAVIAAAVAMAVKKPHQITSIQQAHQPAYHPAHLSVWALEGRRHIHHTRRAR